VKRSAAVLVFIVFLVVVFTRFSPSTRIVSAQDSYTIQRVDHEVEIMYSGHVVIRDTIQLSGQLTGDFLMGFPYKYGSYVLKGMAYDANSNVFPLSLGVDLAELTGFYGAKVSFPQEAPQVFTVVFVLSNNLLSQDLNANVFTLDFPAYPSFTQEVEHCNVAIILPDAPVTMKVTKDDGEVSATSFVKETLPMFTYSTAVANFSLSSGSIQIITLKELNRQIKINPVGDIVVFDSYRITNNGASSLLSLKIGLPLDASNIVARDEFGRILTPNFVNSNGNTRFVNFTFISTISSSVSTLLTAEYTLPSVSSETSYFSLDFDLFPDFDYYVEAAKVTFVPPEGARLIAPQLSSIDSSSSLIRDIFQETFSISREGVSKIDSAVPSEDVMQIEYTYNPLWLSFRPALWMWTLAVIGCVVVVIWRRPKASVPSRISTSKASIALSPDQVRSFTEAYEDRSRITSELKTLEERAQKGKIPRRRYKVQRRTLEVRLDNISKNISKLKRVFHSAGGNYASLVRQLNVAEAELVDVETNTRTIEVRHKKGALPLDAYKRSLADYQRRKEKAEATINGILLRLREEIR
jgi:hypothetical protein